MADPTKVIKGGLSAVRNASRAADQALEAKRLALEAANPPIKASEAYGQHEGAYMKPIFYDRMKVDLSQGKKGGPGFSGIQLVDPNYADAKAVAGVTDQKMATRILNRNKAGVPAGAKVIWTPSVGGLEQHKSNSTMFGQFADIFANQRKNMSNEEIQKLSDRASNAVNNKGELIFPNGIDLGSRNFRQKVTTYDQRGLMADIFAGRGVGGEKGRTVPMEDLLEKNLDPNVAGAGTLDLGNRLFRLDGSVIDRPDLHSDYRKILTGEDLGVNYIPVPIRDVYSDWEAQKALDLIAQGKNRAVTLMDYTKNDPTVQLTEELLTKMQKAGQKKGGVVRREESPEDMAMFNKRFALHKATGGKVDIPHLSLKKAKGGGVHMVDGGKMAKGLMGVFDKASKAADAAMAAPAVNRLDMNFKDVTKRVPELTEAANKLAAGELSSSKYDALVNKVKPVAPYSFVPQPATTEDAMRALTENKKAMFGKTNEMTPGEQADLRLDIPAYKDHGVWVNSIHRKDAPTVYGSVSSVKNASMIGAPDKALKVAQGGPKAPFAVIRGEWNPVDDESAVKSAQKYLNHKDWRQVGYDPERHGYFYDRVTMEPVTNAEEVLQIGPLVLAKKPVYGKKSEEKYADGGKTARGGAAYKESPEEIAAFKKRFALHKATGGKINIPHLSLKKPKKFDGGGIAAADVGTGVEDKGITKAGLMTEYLAKAAKEQGKEELSSLKKPRAITDLLNRGVLANNPLSAGVDLFNMGLTGIDTAINAVRPTTLGELVTGKQDKKYLSSEKPFLGSEYVKDLMNQYGVTSGEERPMMETALSFASPTAMIKGAMKATDTAKKAPELIKKASDAFSSSKMSPLATEAKTATAGKPTGATYATKQEGPFFRVSPTTLDTSKAKTRGVREADELQGQAPLGGGAGSTGSQVPTRLADEEVARIIADPVANEPLNIAKKYTQETQGADFVLPDIPESSLVKQSAIGRAQQLAVEGSPEYKTAVFDAYAKQMPDVLEQAGAKNYDDLMEKAYRQMAKETDDQFKALPYNFSYHRAGEGNYNSSKEMAADVHGNKHLYVYQGGDKHDFLNRIDPASGLNENEKFRAVHDLLGHAIYGNQFGPKGEEMAWAVHSQMYSPLARLAMTAETRGQNSMVNYSPLNANLKAELAKYDSMANEARRKGDKALLNEINAAKRQAYAGFEFAPNKAVLLPPEFLSTQYAGGMPSYLEAANRPVKGTETQSVLTHFSNDPNLQFTDPRKYGSGIKGAEGERLRDYPGAVKDRSYFYLGEPGTVAPEPGLGVNRYRGEASSLYDITQDPLNFQRLARESNRTPFTAKYNQGMTYPLQDANDVERLVKEYGYQGMANPKATKPMAIMFKETPVRRQARGGLTLMK
jgi:hypothetical protein